MNTSNYTTEFKLQNDNRLVIDIETMPNPAVLDLLPEPSIDSRLKDPEKIEAAKAKAKQDQLEDMALSPLTGKIACVGWKSSIGEDVIFGEGPELLDATFNLMKGATLITFNGKAFDIPYIFKRGIILQRPWATIPAMEQYTDRYKAIGHIDLMEEFCGYQGRERLDNLGRFILGYGKSDFDFRAIPKLLETAEGRAEIASYCAHDCRLTWELALRLGY